jgi:hypothetical protein
MKFDSNMDVFLFCLGIAIPISALAFYMIGQGSTLLFLISAVMGAVLTATVWHGYRVLIKYTIKHGPEFLRKRRRSGLRKKLMKLQALEGYVDNPIALVKGLLPGVGTCLICLTLAGCAGLLGWLLSLITDSTRSVDRGMQILIIWLNLWAYLGLLLAVLAGAEIWLLCRRVTHYREFHTRWTKELEDLDTKQP